MGCCQNETDKMDEKAGGCCGGGGHHAHPGMVKQEKTGESCKGGTVANFIKKLFGAKKEGCCN